MIGLASAVRPTPNWLDNSNLAVAYEGDYLSTTPSSIPLGGGAYMLDDYAANLRAKTGNARLLVLNYEGAGGYPWTNPGGASLVAQLATAATGVAAGIFEDCLHYGLRSTTPEGRQQVAQQNAACTSVRQLSAFAVASCYIKDLGTYTVSEQAGWIRATGELWRQQVALTLQRLLVFISFRDVGTYPHTGRYLTNDEIALYFNALQSLRTACPSVQFVCWEALFPADVPNWLAREADFKAATLQAGF